MSDLRERLERILSYARDCEEWEYADTLEYIEEEATCALALIQKEQGWRDIESAPRDGTDILVFCEDSGEQFVGFNNPAEGSDREDVFFTALLKGGKRVGCIPSHWMPLPTPPQGEDG